ncbi:hypothetical protein Acsp06_51630 [Actinomycetospora sp. NBRC 106375]|nr:hypothetical protein Acsp06_51630 [Actinomycetospora sp. NBRC 106375]
MVVVASTVVSPGVLAASRKVVHGTVAWSWAGRYGTGNAVVDTGGEPADGQLIVEVVASTGATATKPATAVAARPTTSVAPTTRRRR